MKKIVLLAASLIIFNGCKKEIQGPQGVQGIQGVSGPSVTNYDFSLLFSSSQNSGSYAFQNLIGNNQDVIVYVIDGNGFKNVLPYKGVLNSATGDNFDLSYSVGTSTLFIYNKTSLSLLNNVSFRAVVIN